MGVETNLTLKITATDAASRVIGHVKQQVAGMSGNMTSSLKSAGAGWGALGGAINGVAGAGAALAPQLAVPLMIVGTALKAVVSAAKVAVDVVGRVLSAAYRVAAAAARALGTALKGVVIGAAVAGAGIAAGMVSAVKAAMQMESYRQKLNVAVKNTQEAAQLFDWAKQFANSTPFEMGEVVDATVRLEMYGLKARQWLPLVGDMAGAMGKQVTDAVEAVADAVSGGGLERLKEFGISSTQLLQAGAAPGAGGGVSYMGQASIDKLKVALTSIMTARFGGGMATMMTTASGAMSNLSDAVFRLRVAVGEALLPLLKASIPLLISFVNALGPRMASIAQSAVPLLARALDWLFVKVLNPEALGRLWAWGQRVYQTFVKWFGEARTWLGTVVPGIIAWVQNLVLQGAFWVGFLYAKFLTYWPQIVGFVQGFGQTLRDVLNWAYDHLPDFLEVVTRVAAGIGRAFLVLRVIGLGLYDTLATPFRLIAFVVTGAAAIVMTGVANILLGLSKIGRASKGQVAEAFGARDELVRQMGPQLEAIWGSVSGGTAKQIGAETNAGYKQMEDLELWGASSAQGIRTAQVRAADAQRNMPPIQVNINAPVYGVDQLQAAINAGIQAALRQTAYAQ